MKILSTKCQSNEELHHSSVLQPNVEETWQKLRESTDIVFRKHPQTRLKMERCIIWPPHFCRAKNTLQYKDFYLDGVNFDVIIDRTARDTDETYFPDELIWKINAPQSFTVTLDDKNVQETVLSVRLLNETGSSVKLQCKFGHHDEKDPEKIFFTSADVCAIHVCEEVGGRLEKINPPQILFVGQTNISLTFNCKNFCNGPMTVRYLEFALVSKHTGAMLARKFIPVKIVADVSKYRKEKRIKLEKRGEAEPSCEVSNARKRRQATKDKQTPSTSAPVEQVAQRDTQPLQETSNDLNWSKIVKLHVLSKMEPLVNEVAQQFNLDPKSFIVLFIDQSSGEIVANKLINVEVGKGSKEQAVENSPKKRKVDQMSVWKQCESPSQPAKDGSSVFNPKAPVGVTHGAHGGTEFQDDNLCCSRDTILKQIVNVEPVDTLNNVGRLNEQDPPWPLIADDSPGRCDVPQLLHLPPYASTANSSLPRSLPHVQSSSSIEQTEIGYDLPPFDCENEYGKNKADDEYNAQSQLLAPFNSDFEKDKYFLGHNSENIMLTSANFQNINIPDQLL